MEDVDTTGRRVVQHEPMLTEGGPMVPAIRALASEAGRGVYLYRSFEDSPEFHSYQQLYRRIAEHMTHFRDRGVGAGTRVLLPFDTSIEAIASFLALIGVGAVTFSVKPWGEHSGKDTRSYMETVCRRFRITHALRSPYPEVLDLSAGVSGARTAGGEADFAPATEEDLALVQFSSGSTSSPKGVPVTRAALERHLQLLVAFDERKQDDVYVSWLPLYHDLGLILGMLTSLYARNDLHLISPFQFIRNPTGWLQLLSDRRATHTATPYFAINYCLNQLERDEAAAPPDWNFESLRVCLIGSDPTDFERTVAFQSRLAPYGFRRRALLPAYGMAETVLVISATRPADEPWAHTPADGRALVSTGGLLPQAGYELRITREDGTLCQDGELGQIEVRGGTLTRGYFEHPAAFLNADGYFETGDLAYRVRGELVIAGRAGDRIKVNGQSLFSSDFEFAVQSLPFIKHGRAVVFQIEDRIIALAEPEVSGTHARGGRDAQRAAIIEAIAIRLGVKLSAADVHFIANGQIQKTSSGKLKRRAMAQAFLDGRIRLAGREAAASGSATTSQVATVFNATSVTEVTHAR